MSDAVDRALKIWRTVPFGYGFSDCMLSIGDYIADVTGEDATGRFHGLYDTEEGALAQMRAHGGVAGLLGLTPFERVDGPPERGDVVALAIVDDHCDEIGALCTGGMIAARLSRGVVEVQTRFVRLNGVWRCPK